MSEELCWASSRVILPASPSAGIQNAFPEPTFCFGEPSLLVDALGHVLLWLCCSFFLRDVRLPPARGRQRRAVGGVHARRVQLLPGELALQVQRGVGSRQDLRVLSYRADSSRVVSLISCRTELEGQTPNPAQLCFGCFHRVSWRFDPKKMALEAFS